MSLSSRALFAFTLFAGLSLSPFTFAQTGGAPAGKAPPKLVLFMVVDGFPQDQLVKYYDLYGDRGFKLLLDQGGWYGNNHYSHATTYTGVGHATLLSCALPYKHGVVGNDWINKKTGKRLYSTKTPIQISGRRHPRSLRHVSLANGGALADARVAPAGSPARPVW